MADCTSIYVDNNIFKGNFTNMLKNICEKLNCKYYQDNEYILNRHDIDRHYIKVDVNCHYSMDVHLENKKNITIYIGDQELTISKETICIHQYTQFDFCFEWHQFIAFLRGEYENDYTEYIKFKINEIKEFSKIFNSKQMIIFNEESCPSAEAKLDDGAKIEDILNINGWKIINDLSLPKCNIKLNEIKGDEEKLMEYKGINYIFHEKWEYSEQFNPYIWENKFVRWEKSNGRIA
jgi:hypothetical protein